MLELKGKKVLVAGGAGFLGTHMILRLRAEGAIVRATKHVRKPKLDLPEIEWIKTDLREPENCAKVVEGMDYVFLSSANTQGAAVIALSPLAHVAPNVAINTNMLDAAHKAGVKKFLFISSGAAYPPTDHAATEDEMFAAPPSDVYFAVGWMKRYAEILCYTYAEKIKNPMPTVVVRPSNVYGPYDKWDFKISHVTAAQIRKVYEKQQPIKVWGSGLDERDLIYVEDFMDGLMAAFKTDLPYLVVNICSNTNVTVRNIIDTAIKVTDFKDAEISYEIDKPATVGKRPLSNAKAKELLGFNPKFGLEEGVTKTIAWLEDNPWALKD
jgi:GDP-L-fucose synthase